MIVAIDPGASGAIAVFDYIKGHLSVQDMPVMEITRNGKIKREISAPLLANMLRQVMPEKVILERVGAMPGQGVSSMFQFGRGVGMIEGVLATLKMPIVYVTPQAWQKAAGVRGGKDGSRIRAIELFPNYAGLFSLKKHDGRADAALMAWYGATK